MATTLVDDLTRFQLRGPNFVRIFLTFGEPPFLRREISGLLSPLIAELLGQLQNRVRRLSLRPICLIWTTRYKRARSKKEKDISRILGFNIAQCQIFFVYFGRRNMLEEYCSLTFDSTAILVELH